MFSLIITVVAIALVAALALATLYYGGSAFGKGASRAEAAKVVLQGQQLLGAADLFYTANRRWPANINELVNGNYLKQVPVANASGLSEALAAGQPWTMVANSPTFYIATPATEVCAEVNLAASLRKRGILRQAYTGLVAQCYGEVAALTTVFRKSTTDPFQPGADVSTDPQPPTDPTDPDWVVPPGGAVPPDNGGGNPPPPPPPLQGGNGLFLESQTFDFGNVVVNGWNWQTMVATNNTSNPIYLRAPEVPGGYGLWSDGSAWGPVMAGPGQDTSEEGWEWDAVFLVEFDVGWDCDPLPPGQSCEFYPAFQPVTLGEQTFSSVLRTSVGDFTLNFRGTGVSTAFTGNNFTVAGLDNNRTYLMRPQFRIQGIEELRYVSTTFTGPFRKLTSGEKFWNSDYAGSAPESFSPMSYCDGDTTTYRSSFCTFNIGMTATSLGTFTGTATVTMQDRNGQNYTATVNLSATVEAGTRFAEGPNVTVTPSSTIDFGTVSLGSTVTRTLTVANIGDSQTFGFWGLSTGNHPYGPADAGATCGSPLMLQAGEDCTASYSFTPTMSNSGGLPPFAMEPTEFVITGYNFTAPAAVPMIGSTSGPLTLTSPQNFDFGSDVTAATEFGSSGTNGFDNGEIARPYIDVVATNEGTQPLTQMTAWGIPQLRLSNSTCGTSAARITLAPGASCSYRLTWHPQAAGAIPYTAWNVSYVVNGVSVGTRHPLYGTAVLRNAFLLSPDKVTYNTTQWATQAVKLTNVGSYDATNVAGSVTGAAVFAYFTHDCGSYLPPGQSCRVLYYYNLPGEFGVTGYPTGAPLDTATLTATVTSAAGTLAYSTTLESVYAGGPTGPAQPTGTANNSTGTYSGGTYQSQPSVVAASPSGTSTTDYIGLAGVNLFPVPVNSPYTSACSVGTSDANTVNNCVAQRARTQGGFSVCWYTTIESNPATPNTYRSRVSCSR